MTFAGFSADKTTQIRIPEQFFRQVLHEIDDLDELRLTLYVFWRLDRMEGTFHYMRFTDLVKNASFILSMQTSMKVKRSLLESALNKAVERGTLLKAETSPNNKAEVIICLNSPKGRALMGAIQRGEWKGFESQERTGITVADQPNIYQLYESNIGPLTPMIAEALRDAESTYPADWIEEAVRIAAERNKRSWHYVEAILHSWQEGGRDDRKEEQNRRDTQKARRRYSDWEK
jgi:DnaD/phage-associated family protein